MTGEFGVSNEVGQVGLFVFNGTSRLSRITLQWSLTSEPTIVSLSRICRRSHVPWATLRIYRP